VDRGLFATWYDLKADTEEEYLDWLHGAHLPAMLRRPGYLWAAHVRNVTDPEREAASARRLVHTTDASVGTGFGFLLMFGAEDAHCFVDPSMEEIAAELDEVGRRMLAMRVGERSAIFVDAGRVEGPALRQAQDNALRQAQDNALRQAQDNALRQAQDNALRQAQDDPHAPRRGRRSPGITPGPVIQFGTFNINDVANETEMNAWYARSRLPLVEAKEGNVGARRLVSMSGWPKHGILYEFETLEDAAKNLVDPSEWSRKVVDNLVHAPHSPTLGVRIWP